MDFNPVENTPKQWRDFAFITAATWTLKLWADLKRPPSWWDNVQFDEKAFSLAMKAFLAPGPMWTYDGSDREGLLKIPEKYVF